VPRFAVSPFSPPLHSSAHPCCSRKSRQPRLPVTVKDDTGGVLPGADIVARNLDTGLSRSAVSSGGGEFTIAGLPPGRYEVRVALAGFNTSVQTVESRRGAAGGADGDAEGRRDAGKRHRHGGGDARRHAVVGALGARAGKNDRGACR